MQEFSGIWVPVVTPFALDGAVDTAALKVLLRHLTEGGVHGIVVCATTGEAATLSEDEKTLVLETTLRACGPLPVVMGVSGVAPADVAAQCRRWHASGITGFLVPPPSYVRPSQQGVIDFYTQVAEAAAPHALLVYDIPYRTGVTLELATLHALAQTPNIRGVKDCGGDVRKTQALIADGRLDVLAGEDHQIFTTLCQGGRGAIAASAQLLPRHFVAMHEAVQQGRWLEARALHHALAPLVVALFAEPNPAPVKAALAARGLIGPTLRAPMTAASPAALDAVMAAWDGVDGCR